MSELVYDSLYDVFGLSQKLTCSEAPGTTEWARRALVMETGLLTPNRPPINEDWQRFKWADQMGLFAWALSRLSDTDNLPFVLHYWDWHAKNAIVNDRGQLR